VIDATARQVEIAVDAGQRVAGLLQAPADARACSVVAHGAGAGMTHPFMNAIARELVTRRIATLRYQFPYMERGSRRPDPPNIAQATVRAAVAAAGTLAPGLPLFAGGKSFGGRMTSQAQAAAPLAGVVGIAFLGFPLHPPGEPSDQRAAHLDGVRIPMLFLQGTRDELAATQLIEGVVTRLGARARLVLFADADHSFHVRAGAAARKDHEVMAELADALATWMQTVATQSSAAA